MEKLIEIKQIAILLKKLVQNDLKSRYSGSAFGVVWAFIQPLVTILVFWYVFQVGFRNPPVANIQFILWYIAAFIPWTYFNDAVMSSSNVMYEYSFLVKKMKFKVWLLPIVKVMSSLFIHLFFIAFIVFMYLIYGYPFRMSWLSMLYYSLAMTVLLIGIAYVVSSFAVFIKDATQMVNIVLQLGFWMTPIFWADESLNEKVLHVLRLNPLYHIVVGYRDALIYGTPFWAHSVKSIVYYWSVSILMLVLGAAVYNKLKDHFSDLL